jgi:hypothetical protein
VIVSHLEDGNALIHATSVGDGRLRRLREARWRGISGQFHREWPKRSIARHQPRLEKRWEMTRQASVGLAEAVSWDVKAGGFDYLMFLTPRNVSIAWCKRAFSLLRLKAPERGRADADPRAGPTVLVRSKAARRILTECLDCGRRPSVHALRLRKLRAVHRRQDAGTGRGLQYHGQKRQDLGRIRGRA